MRGAIATLSLLGCVAATSSHALCAFGESTLLSCFARDASRSITMCLSGEMVRYAYGRPGQTPELQLTEPITTIAHLPWNGIGRNIWEATKFRNGAFSYEVYLSQDRLADGFPVSGGVTVMKGTETIATIPCDPGTAAVNLFALSDAKTARGVCWDTSGFVWAQC